MLKKKSKHDFIKEKLLKILLLKNNNKKHSRSNSYSNLNKENDLYVKNVFH